MKKVLFLVPHLSTGGMPQYTYDLMRKIQNDVEVYCVEYSMIAWNFVVQRNRIISLLDDRFFCLGDDKQELFSIIEKINPDIIHLQEMPEYFLPNEISDKLYSKNRKYFIVETSHDSSFSAYSKRYYPDHLALISQYQIKEFSKLGIPIDLIEADIEYKERMDRTEGLMNLGLDPNLKHVLNVGLFTPRKNQAEAIEYARRLQNYPIQFHFVGNQADNFADYWQPLLKDLPSNVKIWGERSDVDNFYSCMDMMLFTSRGTGNDKETSPLVIRESIGHHLPALIYNLPVYMGMYDKYDSITYLNDDVKLNDELILNKLGLDKMTKPTSINTLNGLLNVSEIQYPNSMYETILKYGEAAGVWWGAFINDELNREKVSIESGDIFVDLGSNIGVSSMRALECGARKVYCFEPDPKLCDIIGENIKNNVQIFRYAISNTKDNLELYHWPYNEINNGPKYNVESITLDDVFKVIDQPIIDYLKIDIEGFEENLFDTVSKTVMRRIRKIFIEHHYPNTTEALAEKIRNFGFEVNIENGNGQNYLYCFNTHTDRYNQKLLSVWYDNTSNKVNYRLNESVSNAVITVRDIDSHTVIWSATHDCNAGNEYWMIPLPKEYYDFETQPNFGGFVIDVYKDDKLIHTQSFRIKKPTVSKPITRTVNYTEPTFINYNEFFCEKIYDKYLKGKSFDTVIDIGANIGLWTEYIDSVSDVQHVYMVEPNKKALEVMFNSFGYSDKFTISPIAISHIDGKLDFFVDPNNSTISSMMDAHRDTAGGALSQTYSVESMTFNSYINTHNIKYVDLLKLDIEGAEYDLLNSMTKEDFDKIGNILLEYHISAEKNMDDVALLMGKLKMFGFDFELNKIHGHGGFIFATKNKNINSDKPRIQAIHLLTNTTELRERKSIESISALTKYGIDYKQQLNRIYDELPPAEFCNRPHHISDKNESLGNGYGTLTGRHYGCYLAHINALKNIDEGYDYTIIFEADANIDTSYEEFVNMIYECCEQSKLDEVYFFGLANNFCPSAIPVNDKFNQSVTQNLAHAYLIPNRYKNWYMDRISDVQWDVSDIWLNEVFIRNNKKRYATTKCYSSQISGPSLIDNIVKWNDEKNHYDYVEIGTCDFETLNEITPDNFRGISVEPIREYLNRLETRDGKTKLNVSISDRDGESIIYYVDEKDIEKHNLPEWVKGCNSIDVPHKSVSTLLSESGLEHLLSFKKTNVISFESFVEQFNIGSIGLLKIDTEGHDFKILRNMLKSNVRPMKLHFEANALYAEEEIEEMIQDLKNAGYHLTQRTTVDVVMSFIDKEAYSTKKPIMVISTGRRISYFKKTMDELIKKNPELPSIIERVWVLDDRSSPEERMMMDNIMTKYFGDNYNTIQLNKNDKFYFVEKFKMIRNLVSKDDVVFLMEDDWECHDNLRLQFHVNSLMKSDWTQIAFADPIQFQKSEIIRKYMIDIDYWKNPYPDLFRHPHKWDSDVFFWNECYINNWTNNPSLIKGEVFYKAQFRAEPGFEQKFANELQGNQVFTNECIFRHFGDNSLINQL